MNTTQLFHILEDQLMTHMSPYVFKPAKFGAKYRKQVIDTLILLQKEIIKHVKENSDESIEPAQYYIDHITNSLKGI